MSQIDEQLYQAVKRNDMDAALEALKSGASAKYMHVDRDPIGRTRIPALFAACKEQNIMLVELLLSHGANPNAEYDDSATYGSKHEPCLFAALPSFEIVKALLESGADPNIPSVWREDRHNERTVIEAAWGDQAAQDNELVLLMKQYGARDPKREWP